MGKPRVLRVRSIIEAKSGECFCGKKADYHVSLTTKGSVETSVCNNCLLDRLNTPTQSAVMSIANNGFILQWFEQDKDIFIVKETGYSVSSYSVSFYSNLHKRPTAIIGGIKNTKIAKEILREMRELFTGLDWQDIETEGKKHPEWYRLRDYVFKTKTEKGIV